VHRFTYKNGVLLCEDVPVAEIAEAVGTPLYVYSAGTILDHYRKIAEAFSPIEHLICYSLKANANLSIVRLLAGEGAGADVVSGGEIYKAILAGVPSDKIVYAGVGKTRSEIEYALRENILLFNVESEAELRFINEIAGRMGKHARVALRINPDVEPETHEYITTGKKLTKFGIEVGEAVELLRASRKEFKNVELVGFHVHIGSQITSPEPFCEAFRKVVAFIEQMRKEGFNIEILDIGGGMGIIYEEESPVMTAKEFADAVLPILKESGCKIILEPGRFIVGNAGVLLTRVLYVKQTSHKTFIIVDAGMNDLIRPSLYGAYHKIQPVDMNTAEEEIIADVVGPICESGDFLAKDRSLPAVEEGALLAVFSAGAYGFSMSSNYNARPRAAEVLVRDSFWQIVRRRETYRDLVRGEHLN